MADTELHSVLHTTPADTPDAVIVPAGAYTWKIVRYRADKVGQDQKTKVTFTVKPIAILEADGVTEEQLADFLPVRVEYFWTPSALKQPSPIISGKVFLRRVLDMSPEELENVDYVQQLEMSLGQVFNAECRVGMEGKNKDIPTSRIARFLAG